MPYCTNDLYGNWSLALVIGSSGSGQRPNLAGMILNTDRTLDMTQQMLQIGASGSLGMNIQIRAKRSDSATDRTNCLQKMFRLPNDKICPYE
eukprot:EC122801.1.p1 GENE.EC122801.1~~EC122801.1.p1  ORF type:complete len:105 (-),score=7.31 EC122801.1:26-301(-)